MGAASRRWCSAVKTAGARIGRGPLTITCITCNLPTMKKAESPKSLRLPRELVRSIELEARRAGRSFTAVATEMLEEAARARKFRHIAFSGSPGRRRATIVGAGLDVWEAVRDFRALGESRRRLYKSLHWIPQDKLAEALAYAEVYATEIEERLELEAVWTEEAVRRAMPWSAASSGSR